MPSLKAIETAAEFAEPAAQKLASAAGSVLSEFVGSVASSEGRLGEQLLSRRRFLRHDAGAAELNAVPTEIDWQMRKPELSEAIARRIMQPRLTEQQFFQPVEGFPKEDRPLVHRLLEYSAGSATEVGLMRSINSVASQITRRFPGDSYHAHLFAASPSSPGNMFGYLYRKSQQTEAGINHFDSKGEGGFASIRSRIPVAVFDDLSHLSNNARASLMTVQSGRPVVAVDVNSFERTVNVIDFAHGHPTVLAKLSGLLRQTKELLRAEPGLEHDQAIRQVLYGGFDQAVEQINRLAPEGVEPIVALRSEPISVPAAFEPVVTPQQISMFLDNLSFVEHDYFDGSLDRSGARTMVAELLAEDVEFHTLGSMIPKLKDLEDALRVSALRRGIDPERDLFVVGSEHGKGSSDGFITHLYKQANGLSGKQIMTLEQVSELCLAGMLDDRRVVALDDAIYSGAQARRMMDFVLPPYENAAFATLSSSSRFARRVHDGPARPWEAPELVTLQSDLPRLSVEHNPLGAAMTDTERHLLASVGSYDTLMTMKVFPHMTSDTSVWWLNDFVGKFSLTFAHSGLKRS